MSIIKSKEITYIPADFSIENWDDIPKAVNSNAEIKSVVQDNLMGYESIDVKEAMKQLATVGDLLKVANAASKGFPSSVPIIGILGDYQTLIYDTVKTTSAFVYNSIAAINQHKLALRIAPKFPDKALVLLSKTAEKAKEMAEMSNKLVEFSNKLIEKSSEALKLATSDQVIKINEERELEKKKNELEARAAELRSEIDDLTTQVAEFKELAKQAGEEAAADKKTEMIFKIIGAITQPLAQLGGAALGSYATGGASTIKGKLTGGNESSTTEKPSASDKISKKKKRITKEKKEKEEELKEKEKEMKELEDKPETPEIKEKKEKLSIEIDTIKGAIDTLGSNLSQVANEIADEYKTSAQQSKDKQTEYLKLQTEYQGLQRKANSELAGSLVRLKSNIDEKKYLEVSIESLEITITTMGRVRVIFQKTKSFWEQVEEHCKRLANPGNFKDLAEFAVLDNEFLVDFINEIKKSGLNWLALANINHIAAMAITTIKDNFDEVMNNLPNREEAAEIVRTSTILIQQSLLEDNKKIDERSKQVDNQIEVLSKTTIAA